MFCHFMICSYHDVEYLFKTIQHHSKCHSQMVKQLFGYKGPTMTTLGTINFDECIIDALRENKLVVFAGAGVSMGPPSNLSSFWDLATAIAQGTGFETISPLDRFLGQLHHKDVAVHERAAQLLSSPESAPNALHYNLLKLFRTGDNIKLVTTNFDRHFTTAAQELFNTQPEIYRAPALPRGYDFSGIVHLHGSISHYRDLVLTDMDFGRAYLTEGWARRFLVDVFRKYTVLFVGYSHDDVVMHYLARALPADSVAGRFALTDQVGSWELLGIKPIRFVKVPDANPFKELYVGVQRLAERNMRGALDWQSRLADLGSRTPPTDKESISEIEQALREIHTTRFLINVIRDPEWLIWLNNRKHLKSIFEPMPLGERDKLIVNWISEHIIIEHPYVLLDIIAKHGLQMNPELWSSLGRKLGLTLDKPLDKLALKRWISILLARAPQNADPHVLLWLAERCSSQGCNEQTLSIFLAMSKHRLIINNSFSWRRVEGDGYQQIHAECQLKAEHWLLNEVWVKHLKPFLNGLAQKVLSGVTLRLELMHAEFSAWDKATRDWDPLSFRRSAIEPHAQDEYPEAVDVLVDATRDALFHLSENLPRLFDAWLERLIISDVPILRRLAIHSISMHPLLSPEERLLWLLDRIGLEGRSEHHELYRAIAINYPVADESVRNTLIKSIKELSRPESGDLSTHLRTARLHFDWFSWLLQAKPDCALASSYLNDIKVQYPDWLPSEHPDLTFWVGAEWVESESPWSVEQLLKLEPIDQINELLGLDLSGEQELNREFFLTSVREACKQNTIWAYKLADVLADRELWSSDLWPVFLLSQQETELSVELWSDLLDFIAQPVLQLNHAPAVANLLSSLVRDGGKPFTLELLEYANSIALSLWLTLEEDKLDDSDNDWIFRAINSPAGMIAEFWINGLSIIVQSKLGSERSMPENYCKLFTMVIQNPTINGGMARVLLASQLAFLFSLNENWASHNIIPIFIDPDPMKFTQVWNGFLTMGRLYPKLIDALLPAFMEAIPRLELLAKDRRAFINFYTNIAVFYVSDPLKQLIPLLFNQGSLEDRVLFTSRLDHIMRQMQKSSKEELWDNWLRRYWQGRLQGIPSALDVSEIKTMLNWLPSLNENFPDAVKFAVSFPPVHLENSTLLYELNSSGLVINFPTEMAELLIYICQCTFGSHNIHYIQQIDAHLKKLPEKIRSNLDDALARAGIFRDHE